MDLATLAEHICCGESTPSTNCSVKEGLSPQPKRQGGKATPRRIRGRMSRSTLREAPPASERSPPRSQARTPIDQGGNACDRCPAHIKPAGTEFLRKLLSISVTSRQPRNTIDGLAYNTKASYGHFLAIAELPETLGALSVEVIRPALVQAFLDGFSDRPASQRNARAALKAVEKWAIVRDRLPWPITFGTEAPGSGGGHEPWSDEQVAIAEAHARHNLSRAVTLGANTGQRGSNLVKMRWTDLEIYEGRLGINVTQQKRA